MAEKTTKAFQDTIRAFLEEKARNDDAFNERYRNEKKSVEECCNFILNTVKETGCQGFTDAEIFGMATHYYDEDEVDPKYLKQMGGKVVVNHQVELTEEEKTELAEKAKKDYYEEQLRKQKELVNKPKKKEVQQVEQMSLF